MRPDQVAEALGVTVKTLKNWRWLRVGPIPRRRGGRIYYRMSDVQEWRDSHDEVRDGWAS